MADNIIKLRNKKTGEIVSFRRKADESDPLLPGLERTERKISARADLLSQVPERIRSIIDVEKPDVKELLLPIKGIKKVGGLALSTLGGLFQRGLAAVANVGLEAQKGKVKTIPSQALKGITGERLGQLGDITRATGFGGPLNEFISATTGLFAAAGVSNLASAGKIKKGADIMRKSFKGMKQAARAKKKFFFIDKADELTQGVDEVMGALKNEYDNLYNIKGLGQRALESVDDITDVQDVVTRLPKNIQNKVQKTIAVVAKQRPLQKVAKGKGILEPTVDSVKTIKTEIGRNIPKKVWNKIESPTELQAQLMDDYHTLNDVIARNAGEFSDDLLSLNAKAKELYRAESIIKGITKTRKGVTKDISRISSIEQRGNLRELLQWGDEFYPQVRGIIKDIDRVNRNLKIQKALLIGIPATAGTSLAVSQIRKGVQGAGGGGQSVSSGGN